MSIKTTAILDNFEFPGSGFPIRIRNMYCRIPIHKVFPDHVLNTIHPDYDFSLMPKCVTVQESAEMFQCGFAPTSKNLNFFSFFVSVLS
jgi:hypothetical protein